MRQPQQLSFEQDIKPLFRAVDREAMEGSFDLWDHEDVSANAVGILEVLENGSMPCDGAWPPDRVDLFRQWLEEGRSA